MADVPTWAFERVEKLREAFIAEMGDDAWRYNSAEQAFARYIAEHEEPPVDPLLIEAREIVARWWEGGKAIPSRGQSYRDGRFDNYDEVQQVLTALKRGMELAKSETSNA